MSASVISLPSSVSVDIRSHKDSLFLHVEYENLGQDIANHAQFQDDHKNML